MTDNSASDDPGVNWEARFQQDDAPWERGNVHPAVNDWGQAGLLEAGQSILVPGCGRSEEPLAFARMGLKVTALDISKTALDWQKARFAAEGLYVELLLSDGLAFRPDHPFDLFYEQTFLCAIHPRQRQAYEAAAYEQIRSGGKLLALFMQRNEMGGPPYNCDLTDMRELFVETRWQWSEQGQRYDHPRLPVAGLHELGFVLTRL